MHTARNTLHRLAGPYSSLLLLGLVALASLSVSRLALVFWQWERVTASDLLPTILLQGVRVDLIQLGLLLLPLILAAPLLAHQATWRAWQTLVWLWGTLSLGLLIFMEAATPAFILEYDLRPDRLFVEYLYYPQEVIAMLWQGFRLPLLCGLAITTFSLWLSARWLRALSRHSQPTWGITKLWLTWPLVLLIVVSMIRSTTDHRPANPAMFSLSPDPLVNSLILNSTWSVVHAIYNLRHEARSSEIYGQLSHDAIIHELQQSSPWLNGIDAQLPRPTWHPHNPTMIRERPLNLVIILEESMGSTYVESLGGIGVTPELERLKAHGWWFDHLYATGTRSVRGIEAVVSGYLPTPARSVVKLSKSQRHFFTLASLLGQQGFHTEFIYGGSAHFDNMRSFFAGNGFSTIIDQNDYDTPSFVGSWGVSDEDLFEMTHQRLSTLHSEGKPFFSLVFTSSNHSPFEFPEGRIELHTSEPASAANAVKYADYALGRFFDKAMGSDYWRDTLFLVVADHDARVHGDTLVPIKRFHIPGLILGADVTPRRIATIASQIDLPVTLLSLMGIDVSHPMVGRDLSNDEEQHQPGRAMMQYANHYAWLEGDSVTLLSADKPARQGHYDPTNGGLVLEGDANEDMANKALAYSLLPAWLYREQRY